MPGTCEHADNIYITTVMHLISISFELLMYRSPPKYFHVINPIIYLSTSCKFVNTALRRWLLHSCFNQISFVSKIYRLIWRGFSCWRRASRGSYMMLSCSRQGIQFLSLSLLSVGISLTWLCCLIWASLQLIVHQRQIYKTSVQEWGWKWHFERRAGLTTPVPVTEKEAVKIHGLRGLVRELCLHMVMVPVPGTAAVTWGHCWCSTARPALPWRAGITQQGCSAAARECWALELLCTEVFSIYCKLPRGRWTVEPSGRAVLGTSKCKDCLWVPVCDTHRQSAENICKLQEACETCPSQEHLLTVYCWLTLRIKFAWTAKRSVMGGNLTSKKLSSQHFGCLNYIWIKLLIKS